jgi:hypothetical protein
MFAIPFLKEVATHLLQPGAYNLTETCIVFPNKRARLYLSKYMGELTEKPIWAPRYITISELMETASEYVYADRISLLFELYIVYSEITHYEESFDKFYTYGDSLLVDFDEIDKYLANAKDLYGNLTGLKNIDGRFSYLSDEQLSVIRRFWETFDRDQLSESQKNFISLWDVLPTIYNNFRERLHGQNMAYEGMAYRKVVENTNAESVFKKLPYTRYIFVGFNALNKCEEKLFFMFKKLNMAEFFWDFDNWFTGNPVHEAGTFMRNNLKIFPESGHFNHENFKNEEKQVYFVPVSSNSGQARVLPYLLKKSGILDSRQAEKTAIILSDESLLIPVLYAVPDYVNELNITMSYPLTGSPVLNLTELLYNLNHNADKSNGKGILWYYADVLAVISDPLLSFLYAEIKEEVRRKITAQNLTFLKTADILNHDKGDLVFCNQHQDWDVCNYMTQIITEIISHFTESNISSFHASTHREILQQLFTTLLRLKDKITQLSISPNAETVFKIIRRILHGLHIPFSGEPLAGLQILGLLETRTLDFEHVIVLSANEGILPRTFSTSSFIPYNLRAAFGLPTIDHSDAIYAYNLYRLLQRADTVTLVYDCTTGGLRTGERSRFMHQLYYESPFGITEIAPASVITQIPVKQISIQKDRNVTDVLLKYSGTGGKILSPSALNEFLNCSLRYYFHHIAGLPQPDEVTNDIDARLFGNILHRAMKFIYSGFMEGLVTSEKLDLVIKNKPFIENALDKAFREELFGNGNNIADRKIAGYNLIVKQIIRTYIIQLLKAEARLNPFSLISLEERHVITYPVKIGDSDYDINLGGIIDRVDNYENCVRIIDYKTGQVKNKISTLASLFEADDKMRNDAAFQVLLYAFIWQQQNPGQQILPGLYFIRNSHSDEFSFYIKAGPKSEPIKNYAEVAVEFENLLQISISQLFNLNLPFRQTNNLLICTQCPYAAICRR